MKYTFEFDVVGLSKVVNAMNAAAKSLDTLGLGGYLGKFAGAGGGGGAAGAMANLLSPGMVKLAGTTLLAVAGLKLLTDAAHSAGRELRSMGRLGDSLGSNAGTTEFVSSLGRMLGFDAGDTAARLANASQSGMGAAAVSAVGLNPQFDITNPVDRGQFLKEFIDGIRRIAATDRGQALLLARQANVPEVMGATRLSDDALARLNALSASIDGLASEKNLREAEALNAEMEIFNRTWGLFFLRVKAAMIPLGMQIVQTFTGGKSEGGIGSKWTDYLPGGGMSRGLRGTDDAKTAQEAAIRENTLELRKLNGMHGTHTRFRGAVPAAYGPGYGQWLSKHWRAETIRWGAYAAGM